MFLIDDTTGSDTLFPPDMARGLVPRDYAVDPIEMFAPPSDMPLIPESEWDARIEEQERTQSSLEHIRLRGNYGTAIPSLDQNSGKNDGRWGYCHPAGTMIRMADGTHKPIEQIRLLDEVLSAEGNVRKVLQLHTRNAPEMCRLKLFGHGHLDLTPNHPVLTKRGYVEVQNLKDGDVVSIPRYAPQRHQTILTAAHVNSRSRLRVGPSGTVFTNPHVKQIPDIIELSEGFGRIIGLWVAEGHVDPSVHEIVWSFNVTERETLATELVGLLKSELGVTARIENSPGTNGVQVKFRGKLWCELFVSLCGKLSHGKRLHGDILSGPLPFLRAVLDGWKDGDGCGKKGGVYGATVSKHVALAMYDIANATGLSPAIRLDKPQVNKYAKSRRPVWIVSYVEHRSDNYRSEVTNLTTWRRVRTVERRDWNAPVFCLGVEVDNSFVAESIGVHNCWSHSTTHTVMLSRAAANQPYIPLSAFAIAATLMDYKDKGAWCGLSAKFARERGIPSQVYWPQKEVDPKYNTPETWDNAAKHKITSDWVDLTRPVWGQNLTFQQVATCLLSNIPCALDYNWWGHSVCGLRLVRIEPGSYGIKIWNSWGDSWGDRGMGVLRGNRAIPDGAIATRNTTAS